MTRDEGRGSGASAAAHLRGMDEKTSIDATADRTAPCRTCGMSITHETRTDPGFQARTGWYDDGRVDPLVCYSAASLVHSPVTA